jgi:predicted acylesterase/phospholipase RssA
MCKIDRWLFTHFVVLIFISANTSLVVANSNDAHFERPRIGLVLSGGGARGFAHIGTLKMLDSLNIPVDYIAGTSMGGIIGALYAVGYSGKEIEEIALNTNWEELMSDTPSRENLPFHTKKLSGKYLMTFPMEGMFPVLPSGMIRGQKAFQTLSKLLYSYQNLKSFDELPIPFRCVAVDIITGNEVVLDHGSLAIALRATMSIPTVFAPVEWGDSLLVDGFVKNNLPVDVVKKMGADIVISVNVGTPKKDKAHLKSIFDILEQTINLASFKQEEKALSESDIIIEPDLEGYSTSTFFADVVEKILIIGDKAAEGKVDACVRLKADYSINKLSLAAHDSVGIKQSVKLHGVVIAGNTTLPFDFVRDLFDLKPGDMCTQDTINACIVRLKKSGFFKDVKYEIKNAPNDEINLIINVKEGKKPRVYGVTIIGNKTLPFFFINNLIDLKPGMYFDAQILDQNITNMYGLGYFETIHYEIIPVDENSVRLIFHIKEKAERSLQVGARFDTQYKFVGVLNLNGAGVFTSEVRMASELQFGGLTRFKFHVSYPTRGLNYPVYPFVRFAYKDIFTRVYGPSGSIINKFHDNSSTYAGGIGFLISNIFNIEFEYNRERVNLYPNIDIYSQPDSLNAKQSFVKIAARLTYDSIDDSAFPSSGLYLKFNSENSSEAFGSIKSYHRYELDLTYYFSFNPEHVIRLYSYLGIATNDLPVARYFYRGGANDFIGADYQQLAGYRVEIAGFEHRVHIFRHLYASIEAAAAYHRIKFTDQDDVGKNGVLYGVAIGAYINSPFGPVKFQYAQGFGSAYHLPQSRSYLFLTIGFSF